MTLMLSAAGALEGVADVAGQGMAKTGTPCDLRQSLEQDQYPITTSSPRLADDADRCAEQGLQQASMALRHALPSPRLIDPGRQSASCPCAATGYIAASTLQRLVRQASAV